MFAQFFRSCWFGSFFFFIFVQFFLVFVFFNITSTPHLTSHTHTRLDRCHRSNSFSGLSIFLMFFSSDFMFAVFTSLQLSLKLVATFTSKPSMNVPVHVCLCAYVSLSARPTVYTEVQVKMIKMWTKNQQKKESTHTHTTLAIINKAEKTTPHRTHVHKISTFCIIKKFHVLLSAAQRKIL